MYIFIYIYICVCVCVFSLSFSQSGSVAIGLPPKLTLERLRQSYTSQVGCICCGNLFYFIYLY